MHRRTCRQVRSLYGIYTTGCRDRIHKLITGGPHKLANFHKGSQKRLNSEIIIPDVYLLSRRKYLFSCSTHFTFFIQRRLLVWWSSRNWAKLSALSVDSLLLRREGAVPIQYDQQFIDHSVCQRKLQKSRMDQPNPPCHWKEVWASASLRSALRNKKRTLLKDRLLNITLHSVN